MAVVPPPASAGRTGSRRTHPHRGKGLRRNNPRRSGVNTMAVVAAVTGVLLFPIPLIALLAGGNAMGQIRRGGQKGTTLAIIGIVLGVVGCVIWVAIWLGLLLKIGPPV